MSAGAGGAVGQKTPDVRGVSFTVAGVPAPQGSKTRTRWGMREDNAATRPWREAVAWEATAAMSGRELLPGPVQLRAQFWFPRPLGQFGTGRNAAVVKERAPLFVARKPDLDKLVRAVCDAMTGIVYRDDSQVVSVEACKVYGSPHARVTVVPHEWAATAHVAGGDCAAKDEPEVGGRMPW